MNDFERLLREILDGTNNFWDARYIGRACYAPITEDLRIKAEFQSTLAAAQYNALKLTAISNKNGVIDSLTLHFSDYFPEATRLQALDTKKYIWTDCGKTEWYVKPKPHELEALAQAADDYAAQFDPEMAMHLNPDMEMG
ncbi:MAG: hypothetical protein IJQ88_10145 [Clostridia bacterium]|nr:hypothetical protein [Clostridia bacterium]